MHNLTVRLTRWLVVASFLTAASVTAQQQFKIAKIEFEGLNRLSTEEVLTTTQLKIGQPFDLAELDAAAQRLIDSGMFKNVAYRTRAAGDQMTITFRVEETKVGSSRVVFDNFIWFTDSELVAAIKRDVPAFSGTAPDEGDTVERVRKSLERFLRENKIEATVSHIVFQDSPGSVLQEHVFSVTDVNMPICSLHFPGANSVSEAKLIERSASLVGGDYSNKFVSLFAVNNLAGIYRELGHLRVAFAPPVAKPENSVKCNSGVDVTITVDEGQVYKWNKAEWSGIKGLTEAELNGVLAMKPGQLANGLKLDKAPAEMQKAYGRKGFILASVHAMPDFDDTAGTVTYKMEVREGHQFRMGKLLTKGFSDSDANMLMSRWELKGGDVFDDEYGMEFSKKHMGTILRGAFEKRRAEGRPAPEVKWDTHVNREAGTVDVSVELVN
jgi:outer membrane protein insertion porin family